MNPLFFSRLGICLLIGSLSFSVDGMCQDSTSRGAGFATAETLRSEGFTPLLSGADLSKWDVQPGHIGHWQVIEDNVLHYDGQATQKKNFDKSLWTKESYGELDRVVDFMRTNPGVKIRLEGHTDSRGVPKHNLRLSKARVESVEEYLVSKGISQRRISGKGYGGTRPIADNTDEQTRRLNRRVEFTIVKE